MLYIWNREKWPDFTWNAGVLLKPLGQSRLAQGRLLAQAGTLGLTLGVESRSLILVEEAVKTSEIEGQKLNAESVRSSVARRLGLSTAGLKTPDRNAEGLIDLLLDATVKHNHPLTLRRLKSWQASLFPTGYSGLKKIRVGQWRGEEPMQVVSGPLGKEKVHFTAPPVKHLELEMKRFVQWFEEKSAGMDGLIRAGIAHLYFVTLHPFEDGNGRIARALTDMALTQDEGVKERYYSMSAQIMTERDAYYRNLEKTQKGDMDITPWLVWFLECLVRAIKASEATLGQVLAKAQFWRDYSQVPLSPRQRKVVNRLLDAGAGGFEGGLSTRKYVGMTKVSRATAYRELADLLVKKILIQTSGKGRNASYNLSVFSGRRG